MAKNFDYRCPECGARDVCVDAASKWNLLHQRWEHATEHDVVTCQKCGHEGGIDTFEIAFIDTFIDTFEITFEGT